MSILKEAIKKSGGLASQADLARMFGVGSPRVRQMRLEYADFPKPVGSVNGQPVWARDEARAWRKARHG